MKPSALLAILALAAVFGVALTYSGGKSDDRTAKRSLSAPAVQDQEPSPTPLVSRNAGLPNEENIRFLGHDWIEVIDDSAGSTPAAFANPATLWAHQPHSGATPCRVCELVRVMRNAF